MHKDVMLPHLLNLEPANQLAQRDHSWWHRVRIRPS